MRLTMNFQLKKPELNADYRRAFLSLLKHSFQLASPDVYEKFYGTGTTMKPFSFAVFLDQPVCEGDKFHLKSDQITLNFSTYRSEWGIYFYNSLIADQRRFIPYPLPNGNAMTLTRLALIKEKTIHPKQHEAVFKTLSPFLVRRHDKESNRDVYLTKNDTGFVPQMEAITQVMIKEVLGSTEHVEFTPVSLSDHIRIKHYGRIVEGICGIFKLTGKPDVLDFIYKAGIGSRRSEGFGLLHLV
ncbi:MAG: CRISPR-associated endoribonuclease Cas6 [Candidatus Omnitrophota bacterium]